VDLASYEETGQYVVLREGALTPEQLRDAL
jgi:hypothetical protein